MSWLVVRRVRPPDFLDRHQYALPHGEPTQVAPIEATTLRNQLNAEETGVRPDGPGGAGNFAA